MEDFERELRNLDFAPPPRWLKARALVAAQNSGLRVARRRRLLTYAATAAAAALVLFGIGRYLLSSFGIIKPGGAPNAHQAAPFSPPGQQELNGAAQNLVHLRSTAGRETPEPPAAEKTGADSGKQADDADENGSEESDVEGAP